MRPPSTGITVPVTYAARSEARNATTARDLGGRAETPCRDLLEVALGRPVGAVDRAEALGVDPPGRDRVDGDPVRAELPGERLQPADDAGPHGVREREVVRAARAPRRTRSRRSGRGRSRAGGGGSGRRASTWEVRSSATASSTDSAVSAVAAAGRRAAAVQDEDVDAAERAHRRLDEALEVLGDRQVALDGERADPLRLALQQLAAAREHRDVRALRRRGPPRWRAPCPTRHRRRSRCARRARAPCGGRLPRAVFRAREARPHKGICV